MRYPNKPKEPPSRIAYSTKEVAQALGCSEKHVKNLVASGDIPSFKLGSRRFIPANYMQQMAENGAVRPNLLAKVV